MSAKVLRIRHNILYNLVFSVLPIGLFLFTVPAYIHVVGTERYGILSLVWVLAGYVGFMNFGSGDALIHSIAKAADATPEERDRLIWSGLWISLVLGGFAALLIWLVAERVIAQTVHTSPDLTMQIHRSIPWIMLSVVSGFIYSAISGIIEGLERFMVVNIVRLSEGVLAALLPLGVAVLVSPRLDFLIAATVVSSVLPAAILMTYLVTQMPLTRVHPPRRQDWVGMLRFGGWLTITSVVGPVMTTLDRFVIGALMGPGAVSHYVVPQGFVSRFSALPAAIARTLFPRLAGLMEGESASTLSGRGVRAVGAIMAPLCCGAILVVHIFLSWWISPEFARTAGPVASLLFFAMFFNSVAIIPFNHMRGTGSPRTPALIHIGELLPFITCAWLCIHYFGIFGAAIAWSIRVIVDFILMFFFAKLNWSDMLSLVPLIGLLALALGLTSLSLSMVNILIVAFALGAVTALVGASVSIELRDFVLGFVPKSVVPARFR